MSNDMNRPAPQTSTDRPTATYPTADHLAHLEARRERLNDLWADATPTEELPAVRPARSVRTRGESRRHPQPAPFVRTNAPQNEGPIQDMGRPGILRRPSMKWHPSLMQLAIGAALVAALLGACNVAAINAHREARAYCHALVSSDWDRAQRECRGTGSGTPVPERLPSSPHTPSESPSQAPSPSTPPALTRVTSPSPSTQPSPAAQAAPASSPAWVTSDTHAPYDRTDPSASPLDLPRCTTAPDTPLPCLAHVSSDSRRAVVLEEDGSMSGLTRR
ncbi:hypothetical protein [Actinomyces oris]|uniref:hypothetical protein n=1 Tax=Actinomyces oris TaxID=544580 RepID=UPI00288BEF8A|nr:hypothetical protein [Actinomyces oris]